MRKALQTPKVQTPLLKKIAAYALTLLFTYWLSWTLAYVLVNGADFDYYFAYWIFAIQGGGERAVFTFGFSVIAFIPLSLISILLVRHRLKEPKKKDT